MTCLRHAAWACAALLAATLAAAQEYEVSSTSMHSKGGVTEFVGNVVVAGPSLRLRADTLSLDEASGRYGIRGAPATLEINSATVVMSLAAPAIDYDTDTHLAHASGGSQLLRGALAIEAESLAYDTRAQSMRARQAFSLRFNDTNVTGDEASVHDLNGLFRLRVKGSPATFNLIHNDQPLAARAARIDYNRASGIVELRGDASATYGNSNLHGEHITYNLKLGSFAARPGGGQRVTVRINLP